MLKYKGFEIEAVYHSGADFRVLADGRLVDRKPTKIDISHYDINDPMTGKRHCAEYTVAECKTTIDSLLSTLNMVDNSPEAWIKLEQEG